MAASVRTASSRRSAAAAWGAYFLAERADEEYRQVVALKIAHDSLSAEGLRSLYRIAKFIARYRVGVITAALVVVSLVGGLAAALSQACEAEYQWYPHSLEVLNELGVSGRRADGPLDDDAPQLIARIEQNLVRLR